MRDLLDKQMSKIDIIQLAKLLKLSKSTVSRAFRDNTDINPITKARVLDMARQLNYRPNHYASNLREQKSRTIAVVIPELANNYFAQIIQGVEKVARTKGYHVLIFVTDDDLEKERDFVTSVSNGRVEGVLMSVSGESKNHSYLQAIDFQQLPIILFDRIYDDIDLPKIVTDDYQSSFLATEHLLENGCKRVAYFVVDKDQSIGKNRCLGYTDALKKHHFAVEDQLIVDCSNSYEENEFLIEKAIKDLKPDGILASVERLAFSTYSICHRLQIPIPAAIKMVAFSSLEIAPLLNPSLSTVTQPAVEIGERGAAMLLQQLSGEPLKTPFEKIVLKSSLVVRRSSSFEEFFV